MFVTLKLYCKCGSIFRIISAEKLGSVEQSVARLTVDQWLATWNPGFATTFL